MPSIPTINSDDNLPVQGMLQSGWASSPNGRGTLDIVWSCLATILLCSWTILCLNLPPPQDGWWKRTRRKLWYMALGILGPEVIFQLAFTQLISARRWTREIKNLGYPNWTITHSFFANSGGFVLNSWDEGCFPLDAAQIHYLLENGYIKLPTTHRRDILDKNKADAVVRVITSIQIVYFLLNAVGRAFQNLFITTLELTTLAFVFSALGTFYCWFHKPQDVETPVVVDMRTCISRIRKDAGLAEDDWVESPLEFVDQKREWAWNLYFKYGKTWMKKWHIGIMFSEGPRPNDSIPNDYWPEPTMKTLPALFFLQVGYAGILVGAWNFEFPSLVERNIWRVASLLQVIGIVVTWSTYPLTRYFSKKLNPVRRRTRSIGQSRRVGPRTRLEKFRELQDRLRNLIGQDPLWTVQLRLLVIYFVVATSYCWARVYILAEDIAGLRAMPSSAFVSVNWSAFIPHV